MDRGVAMCLRVVLLAAALALPTVASAAPLPLEDGFEAVASGDYPDETGWQVVSLGKSAWVSEEVAFSGSRSFRVDCWPWSPSVHAIAPDEMPDRVSFEASVYVDAKYGLAGLVGFLATNASGSSMWNSFRVDRAGWVEFYGEDVSYVGPYQPGTWCTVGADLDYSSLTADLWLDGQLVAEGVPIVPKAFASSLLGDIALSQFGVNAVNTYAGRSFVFSNLVYVDDVMLWEPASVLSVAIDIKPGSETNPVNRRSRGLLPVAVLSDEAFDATEVDPATVSLLGAGIAVKGRHQRYQVHREDVDGDGLTDLLCHFETDGLDFGQLEDGQAVLRGLTSGGQEFEGWDAVRVVPRR